MSHLCVCLDANHCPFWREVSTAALRAEQAERLYQLGDQQLLDVWLKAQTKLTDARARWFDHMTAIDDDHKTQSALTQRAA